MVEIGHKLVSELHGPQDLVQYAQLTEDSALEFANVSDHYHPWLPEQDESPMVWNVLGAIAQATDDLEVWTGVTCPTMRIHPQEALPSSLLWDLPTPAHFADAVESVSRDDVAEIVPCGPDPDAHIETIQEYVDAGFDMVAIHQVGSEQADFLEFYEEEVLPSFE